MERDLERRLRRVEIAGVGSDAIEIWIDQGDGFICGPRGERLTREEAEARGCGARKFTIVIGEVGDERL
jgi:hypothetical protein